MPDVSRSAFTLIEMMLALAVSAIVLAGIGGVFYSALHLRERTVALVDESAPLYQAFTFMRRDLENAVGPGGVLQSNFICGSISSGTMQGFGLQFCTATGNLKDDAPWGDVQEVTYMLRNSTDRTSPGGKDLIRSVTRNLLSTTAADSEDQYLMGKVQNMELACFDGSDWRDSWDTSMSDTNLPVAVRIRLELAADDPADARNEQPIEMIFPIVTQSRANSAATNTVSTP